jgi:[pyruvate, water dikinase]-phosphate phosphotransferase / [pyruvate, water dikinase] kinase
MSRAAIYIISGGVGASAEYLVHTALAQFEHPSSRIVVVPGVRQPEQVEPVVAAAAESGGLIVHTLVDDVLRDAVIRLAEKHQVPALDLMGPLLGRLATMIGQPPLNQPGRYRQLKATVFARAEAIEWTLAHDDGRAPQDLADADIVLVGVSRVGKTPTSMYLAVMGWRVANISLVPQIAPPPQLFAIDRRRVVGLTIAPDQLAYHRSARQSRLALPLGKAYSAPEQVEDEIEEARRLFRRNGFRMIDVTNKPIEYIADRVVEVIAPGWRPVDDESLSERRSGS